MQLRHTLKLAFAAIIGMASLSSCDLDDDDWNDDLDKAAYIAVGTVKKTDGKFYIEEDNLNTIMPRNYQNWNDTMIDKRVWIKYYTYKSEHKEPGFGQTAYLFDLGRKLLTKPIFKIETTEQNDSIGNDAIGIRTIWVTGKYLNVEFIYSGSDNHVHYINLAQDLRPKVLEGETATKLEIRHNAKDDMPYRYYQGVASFDISEFYPDNGGKLTITYKPYHHDSRTFNVELPNLLYTK